MLDCWQIMDSKFNLNNTRFVAGDINNSSVQFFNLDSVFMHVQFKLFHLLLVSSLWYKDKKNQSNEILEIITITNETDTWAYFSHPIFIGWLNLREQFKQLLLELGLLFLRPRKK